ncbi:MAG: response regulator [Actinomycetota bacterium]|nr:response regulator [Actinomycetota bacterium]
MIRTLVVDDDFRVAHIHAASVNRIEGFACVGEANSAAQARELVAGTQPDLLLLDIYLPDEDGMSLLRSLGADREPPDCIFITAARDLDSVRAAMKLGAVYYLVKPFGFTQLRDQLEAYRRWREESLVGAPEEQADQARVDSLYTLRHQSIPVAGGARRLPPTMARILDVVREAGRPVSAAAVATELGLSRPTAQRYLTELHRRGLAELDLEYGSAGRPVHLYRLK